MQIAIVHYHLNRGGVSQVIANQLRALSAADGEPTRIALFYGGRHSDWPHESFAALENIEFAQHVIPELDYDPNGTVTATALAARLDQQLRRVGFAPDDTVVHVHNHALGKNAALPEALAIVAQQGWPLLLQIHDFMEDFRPVNYQHMLQVAKGNEDQLAELLYPQGSAIHYAVLNGRDRSVLEAAGVGRERLHWLPNPVADIGGVEDRGVARAQLESRFAVARNEHYLLYPVRAIRRKNLGELLLWSALVPERVHTGVTLAPMNPVEQPRYAFWKQLAAAHKLRVLFETGGENGLSFAQNLAASDLIVTTSVAEGFGMVYLEAWLHGRRLVGRNLPDITRDFEREGIELPGMYDELLVPVAWVGRGELEKAYEAMVRSAWQSYGRSVPSRQAIAAALERVMRDDHLDFGRFPVRLQARIIGLVASSRQRCDELRRRNPVLDWKRLITTSEDTSLVDTNAAVVRRRYGVEASGARLRELYRKVLDSPRGERYRLPCGRAILDNFLALNRLFPPRIEP